MERCHQFSYKRNFISSTKPGYSMPTLNGCFWPELPQSEMIKIQSNIIKFYFVWTQTKWTHIIGKKLFIEILCILYKFDFPKPLVHQIESFEQKLKSWPKACNKKTKWYHWHHFGIITLDLKQREIILFSSDFQNLFALCIEIPEHVFSNSQLF